MCTDHHLPSYCWETLLHWKASPFRLLCCCDLPPQLEDQSASQPREGIPRQEEVNSHSWQIYQWYFPPFASGTCRLQSGSKLNASVELTRSSNWQAWNGRERIEIQLSSEDHQLILTSVIWNKRPPVLNDAYQLFNCMEGQIIGQMVRVLDRVIIVMVETRMSVWLGNKIASPHVRESGIRNPANFCCWNPESRDWNPESTMVLESGIQKVGIRNPKGWNPESRCWERLGSGIQDLRGFSYMGRIAVWENWSRK